MAAPQSVAMSFDDAPFDVGDVVVERVPPHRLGRVCVVGDPGTIYSVFYSGGQQCEPAAHDALALAPAGSGAPHCPAGC